MGEISASPSRRAELDPGTTVEAPGREDPKLMNFDGSGMLLSCLLQGPPFDGSTIRRVESLAPPCRGRVASLRLAQGCWRLHRWKAVRVAPLQCRPFETLLHGVASIAAGPKGCQCNTMFFRVYARSLYVQACRIYPWASLQSLVAAESLSRCKACKSSCAGDAQARRAPSEGAEPESADEAGRAKSSCLRVLATAQGQWGVPIAAWQCNVSEM